MFFRAFHLLQLFSRAFHVLHVFPRFPSVTSLSIPTVQPAFRYCLFLMFFFPQDTSKRIRRSSSLNTCAIHIAADHLFVKHVGSGSESATVAEMVYHVAMADKAFRATDFNQDGGPGDNVGFVIAAVTVFNDTKAEGNKMFVCTANSQPLLPQWW